MVKFDDSVITEYNQLLHIKLSYTFIDKINIFISKLNKFITILLVLNAQIKHKMNIYEYTYIILIQ